jgi:putative ABC transport system permease protein
MSILLIKTSVRYLLRHPWQVGLSILGVALGVAVVVAIDLANTSARRAFTLSTETVTGRTTHQIVGSAGTLDETVYRQVVRSGSVTQAAPIVEGYVSAAAEGVGPIQVLGIDPFAENGFRSFSVAQTENAAAYVPLLSEPATGIISEQTAQRARVQAGDTLTVLVNGQRRSIRIVGLLKPPDEASRRALDGTLLCDIATAQELLGQVGHLSRIDLILPEGAAGEQAQTTIAAQIPPGTQILRSATRTQAIEQLARAFETNLTALSLLALVVGMFLIYNTVTFSVVQRRGLLGTLRCIGVTRREIFVLILTEAALLGVVGSLLGLVLGTFLGSGLVRLVTQTINDLYFVVTVRGLFISPLTLIKGLGLGLGATLLTALVPANEAGSTPPRTVLRRSSLEERLRKALPLVTALSVLVFLAGGVLLLVPSRSLWLSFGGLFGLVFGCALLTPVVTLGLMTLLRPLGGWIFGLLGRMAARDVIAALSRTSVAIAALMVAMSVTVGVGIMVGSFRQTVITWLDTSLRADIYVSPPGFAANRVDTVLDPAVIDRLSTAPGIVDSVRYRNIIARSGDDLVQIVAIDVNERGKQAYSLVSGSYDTAWQAFASGAVFVSEPFAYRFNVPRSGGTITLQSDNGPQTFQVAGIFYDYSSDQGVVVMALDLFQRHWTDRAISSLALYVAPEQDVDTTVDRLRGVVGGQQDVIIRSNRGLRQGTLEIFDRTFAITSVLQLLATMIAFVGVLSALMALQLERARELGVMRANGLTPRQLWGVVLGQTGLMGFTAGLLSLPVGMLVAFVLVYVINRRSFGWTLQMTLPPGVFAQALILALIAALLAGIYPAYRMARTPPALALREE